MSLFRRDDADAIAAVAAMVDGNPFLPERIALERRALGRAFVPHGPIWHAPGDLYTINPNTPLLRERAERLAADVGRRLAAGAVATPEELQTYRGLAMYLLWLRYEDDLYSLIEIADGVPSPKVAEPVACYERFAADVHQLLDVLPGPPADPERLFAVGFQARRAFHYIFRRIFGGSLPAARLRADIWCSLFTTDPVAYRAHLVERLRDTPTLITGESGTGKELVASAIAHSQFLPFDAKTQTFAVPPDESYFVLHIAALSQNVVEAELFGHRRGAFTGADREHRGWFEMCPRYGTVFLDEIGELDPEIQVKLLRILQSRTFQRVGETTTRHFEGKVIAATLRDLDDEIEQGRFREDLYYRLCADSIATPSLRDQLADAPEDLANLVGIVARKVVGPEYAPSVTEFVVDWIQRSLPADYAWRGNIRELEQCVRSVVLRGSYVPRRGRNGTRRSDAADALAAQIRRGELSASALQDRYVWMVHDETQNERETARRTGLSRNTVSAILAARQSRKERRAGKRSP